MTGKTMLGLVVLAIGLSTIPAFAESETIILSPYQQFKNGTPINEIQCKDSKILMESPRNTPACVNENSVEKLEDKGYIILYPLQTDFKDNSESSETALLDNKIDMMISENANSSNDIQTKYIYTNDKSTGGHGYQGFTRTPLYSLEIPNSINVGETVSINYTLSWFNPDGTSILDGIIDEEERYDIVNSNVGIVIPDEFTVLNEDKTFFKTYADQYTPHTATWYEFNEGYSTELISGSIDVRLDKEMMYDLDQFTVFIGGEHQGLITQKTDDGIVLRERSSFTDKSDIYTINTMGAMFGGEENGRYDVLYLQDVPHIPEFRTAQQTFNEPQENIYIDKDWEGFAEYLRFAIDVENITDVREWLINTAKTSEKFVDDFFKVYPEFDDRAISENANSSNDIQTKYIYTNDKSTGGHGYQGFTRTPLYSLEIPNSINVGETVSINYTLSWFNPDGTSILDGIIDEEERYDIVNSNVGIVIPDEFTVLNEDKTFFKTYADQYTPHTATWYEFNEGYSTELISGSIDVRLDKEMMYDLDQFTVFIGGEHQGLITQKTDDGIVLRERSSFTDKSDIYTINTMGAMFGGEENGRYDVLYLQDVPHIPEFRTAQQTFNEPQENLYIPREGWDTFSEFLNLQIQNYNITNVRSWLLAQNLTENFVDDFFAEYPELRPQTINHSQNPIINPTNIDGLIPQDFKLEYAFKISPDNVDNFAQKITAIHDDKITKKNILPNGIRYDTQRGSILIYDNYFGYKFPITYTFFGKDRIHPDLAEETTMNLLDELGIVLDGTELFKHRPAQTSSFTYWIAQQKDGFMITSNQIKTTFDAGYTFFHIGNWNADISEFEMYDFNKSRENAIKYLLSIDELTGKDCNVKYKKELEDRYDSVLILDGYPTYQIYSGTCQTAISDGHYRSYHTIIDGLSGEPLFAKGMVLM